MRSDDLPKKYQSFRHLKVGSNELDNVSAILEINGYLPLLLGDGITPKVWLSVPANTQGTDWYTLIKENFSSHPEVKVETGGKFIKVRARGVTVLNAIKTADKSLSILKLDLRPFGLEVFADNLLLNIMGNRLSNNEFRNVRVVVSMGNS